LHEANLQGTPQRHSEALDADLQRRSEELNAKISELESAQARIATVRRGCALVCERPPREKPTGQKIVTLLF